MEIDKRVMDLLKANCLTVGANINQLICAAMKKHIKGHFGYAEDVVIGQWDNLLVDLKEEKENNEE